MIFSHSKSEDKEEKSIRTKRHILLMFERPFEPLVLPKGPKNTRFNIPDSYWVSKHVRSVKKYLKLCSTESSTTKHRYILPIYISMLPRGKKSVSESMREGEGDN